MNSMQAMLGALLLGAGNLAIAGGGVYPQPALPDRDQTITRAQVKAELMETIRLGLLPVGDGDVPVATPEQQRQIAEAGRRAAEARQLAAAQKQAVRK